MHGGKRKGAGRPQKTVKTETIALRVRSEFKNELLARVKLFIKTETEKLESDEKTDTDI